MIRSLPLFYYPNTWIWIDDDKTALNTMTLVFGDKNHSLISGSFSNPTISILLAIISYFNFSFDQTVGIKPFQSDLSSLQNLQLRKIAQAPIIFWRDVYKYKEILKNITARSWNHWVSTNLKLSLSAFAIHIKATTMPFSYDNDSLYIVESCEKISKADGKTILLIFNSIRSSVIKTVLIVEDQIWLISLNKSFPLIKSDENWTICGLIRQYILTLGEVR